MSLPPSVEGIISVSADLGLYNAISYPMIFNQYSTILYGISTGGGFYNQGCIYSIDINNGNLNILYSLKIDTTGYYANYDGVGTYSLVFNNDYTTLYGITTNGYLNDSGTIFSFNILTNTFTILTNCNATIYGKFNSSLLLSNDGSTLYGMSQKCIFKFNLNTNTISPLFNGFVNQYANQGIVNPYTIDNMFGSQLFILNGQYLFGYCYKDYNRNNVSPGFNYSYIYKIDLSNSDISNNYQTLYTFDGSNNKLSGINAICPPIIGFNGKMYGLTQSGGLNGYGTFYSIDLNGNFNVVYNFTLLRNPIYDYPISSGGVAFNPKVNTILLSNDKKIFYFYTTETNYLNFFNISNNSFSNIYGYYYQLTELYGFPNVNLVYYNSTYNFFLYNNGSNKTSFARIFNSNRNVNVIKSYNPTTNPYGYLEYNTSNVPNIVITDKNNVFYFITNNKLISYRNDNNTTFLVLKTFTNEIPISLIYNQSNHSLYGITKFGGAGYGIFYCYNITTNSYTILKSFNYNVNVGGNTDNTNYPIGLIIDSANQIIYGINSITSQTNSNKNGYIWKYIISSSSFSVVYSDLNNYYWNSSLILSKDGSTIFTTYYSRPDFFSDYIYLLSINTKTGTSKSVFSNINQNRIQGLALNSDQSTLYYTSYNNIYSYNIYTSLIQTVYTINSGYYFMYTNGLLFGGNKNNNHILYGISQKYSTIIYYLYSFDVLTKVYTILYQFVKGYTKNDGVPFGSLCYAVKDTILISTYNGGTYNLGAIVKIRIHYPEAPCFLEGTKILCLDQDQMVYVSIQDIRKGMKVKTLKHGFVPVNMIGVSEIENEGDERIMNRLYRLKQEQYPDLFDDLVITGCHSILVDQLSNTQILETLQKFDMVFMTDDKYRLLACLDEKTQPYEKSGKFTIYHLALDHENYFMNYGIYANGLLVESCSQRYIKELSGMRLIE